MEGFDEANSGFLSLIHSYSAIEDYISVDNPDSAALYKAEFVGADEIDARTLNIDTSEEPGSITVMNSISESITGVAEIERFDTHERVEIHIEDEVIEEPSFMQIEDSLQESVEKIEETEHPQEEYTAIDVIDEQIQEDKENESVIGEETSTLDVVLPTEQESTDEEIVSLQSAVSDSNPTISNSSAEVVSNEVEDTPGTTATINNSEVYSSYDTQTSRGYIPSLSSKIDTDKRETLIKKMFHKDSDLYDTFVREIDKTYSWKEAAAAIDRFYVRHNIKDSGALAKELRTIIQKRYAR